MNRRALFILTLSCFVAVSFLFAQLAEPVQSAANLEDPMPVDPDVMMGSFENGVRYYIKENKKPEKRATLWLSVNAGSVLEDENQRGLAHFAEHMGFNGTKNFEKQKLVDYLESIGMQFGPEVNAYTSFDETVYFIHVPTDSAYFVETGFQILEDWAHNVTFEDEEIDKERGVIIEEWRLGRGAGMRMLDKQLPIMFQNSRYAERLPIGKKEIVESCDYETLRSFYRDWYRPDLMAIVAVGDFDKVRIFELIQKHFASIPVVENARERKIFPVPDHDEVLFAIASDPEADMTQVSVYFMSQVRPQNKVADYRKLLMEKLYNNMMNSRLDELTRKADPPFLFAYSGKGRFVRSKEVYALQAAVKEGGTNAGLDALMTEALRVRKHGFTASELKRSKDQVLRNAERAFQERDKTESNRIAERYVYHYLQEEPIPSEEQELLLVQQFLPTIQLEDLNAILDEWITDNNRVIRISAVEKEGVPIPTEDELLAVFTAVENKEIEPYVDTVTDEPLVADPPEPGDIIEEEQHEDLGVTEWMLSNGVHVVLKPTDFKNDEIRMQAYSFGGSSLVADSQYMSAAMAAQIVDESGLGRFSITDLQKKLTGKIVNVQPYINSEDEGFYAMCSPRDVESMLQIVYLFMTAPRTDPEAFASLMTRLKGELQNRSARPESAFYDTLQVTLAQHHPRSRPMTVDLLNEIEHETAVQIYKERFADASDFHFFFVGSFEPEQIKPLVLTYLGGLPSLQRNETWRDTGLEYPNGVIKKEIHKGIEPKSRVQIVFTGDYKMAPKNYYDLSSMISVLDIKLREVLREEMGGTYGAGVGMSTKGYPRGEYRINISFGTDPKRVDEMIKAAFVQIDSLKSVGPADIYIKKVRETQIREYEVNLKNNNYWINELRWKHYFGEDWAPILTYPQYIETLSPELIKTLANRYFNENNYVQVVLYPGGE